MIFVYHYDTPKDLKERKEHEKLNELMGKIYHTHLVQRMIDEIVIEEEDKTEDHTPSFGAVLCNPKYKWATFTGIILSCFMQLSGVYAIIFYSSSIYYVLPYVDANTATVFTGFVNFIACAFSFFILKRWGRKSILSVLTFVLAGLLILLAIAYRFE